MWNVVGVNVYILGGAAEANGDWCKLTVVGCATLALPFALGLRNSTCLLCTWTAIPYPSAGRPPRCALPTRLGFAKRSRSSSGSAAFSVSSADEGFVASTWCHTRCKVRNSASRVMLRQYIHVCSFNICFLLTEM